MITKGKRIIFENRDEIVKAKTTYVTVKNVYGRIVDVDLYKASLMINNNEGELIEGVKEEEKKETQEEDITEEDLIKVLREEYKKRFGKYPSSNMKLENLRKKLNG